MFRGVIQFKCDKCGSRFKAPDIEYNATVLSMPQRCPKCGSRHTYPASMLSFFSKSTYKKIWEEMDE